METFYVSGLGVNIKAIDMPGVLGPDIDLNLIKQDMVAKKIT